LSVTPPVLITRHRLLVRAGVAVAGAVLASRVTGMPWLGERAEAAASAGDWADLARSVSGKLLRPDDAAYAVERLPWNALYDRAYPQAVLQVATVADVRRGIDFCRDTGVRPIPRSGGHSFQGFSTGTGLVLDLSRLDQVTMTADRTRARVGAGANLLHIYDKLAPGRMAIAGGTCPTVGIAGLTQGGGIGPFTRQYGLTLDRLMGAEIVTADGKRRYLSRDHEADLFWAIRGGGGGSFGVVTAFDFAPVPVGMENVAISLTFPWGRVDRVLEAYQQWVPTVPLYAHPGVILRATASGPGSTPAVVVSLWHRGPRARADALVRAFIAEAGVRPTSREDHAGSFFEAEYREFCDGLRREQCARDTHPPGVLPRLGLSTYSEITREPWPAAAIDVMTGRIERWQRSRVLMPPGADPALQVGKVLIEPVDGAVHRVASDATAWPHRDGFLCMQYQARVPQGASQQLVNAAQEWLEGLHAGLSRWRTGAEYSNYGNRNLRAWGTAYYGGNLARLRRIKARRDPHNLFRFAQSIRPANPSHGRPGRLARHG
jgi:FAD/FMN-containing dehydrogenase